MPAEARGRLVRVDPLLPLCRIVGHLAGPPSLSKHS